jgi:hypothetical protein
MGGANTVKGNWVTEKKTPQALGDAPLHENPQLLKPYKDLLTTGQQNISLEEMIAPYYGGEETLKSEIEAAKAYSLEQHPEDKKWYQVSNPPPKLGLWMHYDRIGEKIPISSGDFTASYYTPKDKTVTVQDPQTGLLQTAEILKLSESTNKEDRENFQKILEKNSYLKKDIEERIQNPLTDFIGTLEHEVGHYSTGGFFDDDSFYHMYKPIELSNQLGRIQREAFLLYGKRFTPDTLEDFLTQQKSVPEDERFQNFSPDTRRGLRTILDFKESPTEFQKYRAVKQKIPEFVKNETKPMSSYDAINAGLEEDTKLAAT